MKEWKNRIKIFLQLNTEGNSNSKHFHYLLEGNFASRSQIINIWKKFPAIFVQESGYYCKFLYTNGFEIEKV